MKLLLSTIFFCFSLFSAPLSSLQHAQIYKDQNITGWVMSEKLDGIRGYWNGQAMFTKSGRALYPPREFTKNFPPFALDGELWSRRQDFEYIQSHVLKQKDQWENINYYIFEVPQATGDFYARLDKAEEWFQKHSNYHVHIIPQHISKGTTDLNDYLDEVVSKGGEGVMIKNPDLDYISGRTSTILKVKRAQDMEGKVLMVNLNDSKTIMKSLTLELTNGIRFKLGNGFSDDQRKEPPTIGSKVTFKYYGFTKYGKPKFASFIRIQKLY